MFTVPDFTVDEHGTYQPNRLQTRAHVSVNCVYCKGGNCDSPNMPRRCILFFEVRPVCIEWDNRFTTCPYVVRYTPVKEEAKYFGD